jgi:pSer/pThr/pTyr-binding forkhead associated (FHA) protein
LLVSVNHCVIIDLGLIVKEGSMKVNLVLVKKDGSTKTISLPSEVVTIGRRRECDLWLPVDSVSKRHCQIYIEDESLNVRDLDSLNGIFVNGIKVTEKVIKPGDCLAIGPVDFIIQIDGEPANVLEAYKQAKSQEKIDEEILQELEVNNGEYAEFGDDALDDDFELDSDQDGLGEEELDI